MDILLSLISAYNFNQTYYFVFLYTFFLNKLPICRWENNDPCVNPWRHRRAQVPTFPLILETFKGFIYRIQGGTENWTLLIRH